MTQQHSQTLPERSIDPRISPGRMAGLVIALTAVLSTLLIAFTLPMIHSSPHKIPLGLIGPPDITRTLEAGLTANDAFTVSVPATTDEAKEMILHREIDGAIVIDDESVTTLHASAASPSVAQLIQATGAEIAAKLGKAHTSVDVRPFTSDDPRGIGLAAGALPLTLGGWAGAVVIMIVVRRPTQQLATTAAFSILGGTVLTSLLFAVGTFDQNFLATCAAGTLGIAATAFGIIGLRSALGHTGIAIAIIALIILGNPLSGLASSPQLLPTPWGTIGQMLPPGATGTLLRNVVFFEGHATTGPIIVLTAWLVGGLALWVFAARRSERRSERRSSPPQRRG